MLFNAIQSLLLSLFLSFDNYEKEIEKLELFPNKRSDFNQDIKSFALQYLVKGNTISLLLLIHPTLLVGRRVVRISFTHLR